MQIFNIDKIPEYFFVFQSFNSGLRSQVNKHNFEMQKRIMSSGMNTVMDIRKMEQYIKGDIDYLPFVRAKTTNNSPSSFCYNIIRQYNIEHNLEVYRKQNCKQYPSRLSAIYAFGDYDSCVRVSKKYEWPLETVSKYKLIMDKSIEPLIKVGRFNMEIVSLLNGIDAQIFSIEEQNELYRRYWDCENNAHVQVPNIQFGTYEDLEVGIISEYLIEGILELVQ